MEERPKIQIYHLQPSAYIDILWGMETGEIVEGTKLPYPFDARQDNGHLINQELWRGEPWRVVGFSDTPETGQVDLWWADYVEGDPQAVLNKYVVTQDRGGGMAVHTTAIQEVRVFEIPEDRLGEEDK